LTLDVKKSNSSNENPNVMTVGVEKYGLTDSAVADNEQMSKSSNRHAPTVLTGLLTETQHICLVVKSNFDVPL
jgi:hypothetical protein